MMAGLGVLAYVIDPDWMAWSSLALPAWLRWTGVALGLTAGSLLTWTLRSLGPNLTDTVVTRKTHTLVTHGPYRSVRHPFYLSVAAAVAASALASANWFVLASGTLWFLLMVMRTAREEERLLARFGDAYRAYAGRAGRFLPSCGKRTREGR
jgi:protein-S-isoprenylcysteine O-methyltransferase Ste14